MNGVRKAKEQGKKPKKQSSIYAPEPLLKEYIAAYFKALIGDAKCIFKGLYSNADATRDYNRVVQRLESEGSGFATRTLPSLSVSLLTYIEEGYTSFPQFRLQRGTEHPAFLGRLFNLVFNSVDSELRTKAIDFIYNFANSFKKLRGPYPDRVIRKLFADFCKTDTVLSNIDLCAKELRPILEDARAQWRIFVAETNLPSLIENSTPQPGPGATNSPTKKHERYRPHMLYTQIDNCMPYAEWFYPTLYDVFLSDGCFDGTYRCSVDSPTARFKAVPKTAGKPRGICIEENEMQVFQQCVRKAFYTAIDQYFGPNIALRKQSVNAQLALNSSLTKEHATIDESEASDRVSRELVSWLSSDNSYVKNILMGLSTRYVVPPDELKDEFGARIKTAKYAPMGSALCFPVMSLVHMFLVRAIIRLSTKEDTKTLCENVYVYGDDIILPTSVVHHVYDWLPKFGLKLNTNKSFYKSHFRESCGVHAYNGVNITPVYVKYIPYHDCADAKASVFAIEEQLFDKKLFHTAELQRSYIERAYGSYPEVPRGLSLAGYARDLDADKWQTFVNTVRHPKSHKGLQCHKLRLTRFKKRTEKLKLQSDLDAYTRWMWQGVKDSYTVSDSLDDLVEVTSVVPESALGKQSCCDAIDDLIQRYPTVNGRYTHPSWFGRLQKNFSVIGARCYL